MLFDLSSATSWFLQSTPTCLRIRVITAPNPHALLLDLVTFPLYPAKFAASTAPMLKAVAGGNVEFPNAGSKCLTPWYRRHNSHCVTDAAVVVPYSNEPMRRVAYLSTGLRISDSFA